MRQGYASVRLSGEQLGKCWARETGSIGWGSEVEESNVAFVHSQLWVQRLMEILELGGNYGPVVPKPYGMLSLRWIFLWAADTPVSFLPLSSPSPVFSGLASLRGGGGGGAGSGD